MLRFCHGVAVVRLLAGIALTCMLHGCGNTTSTSQSAAPTSGITTTIASAVLFFNDLVRQALEDARDTKINPLIAASMPDPLPINLNVSGTAHPGCGGCLCPATAKYAISLKEVDGLSSLHISNFKTVEIYGNEFECLVKGCDALVVAEVAEDDVTVQKGIVDVTISTCGISPHTKGSVTTHVDVLATLAINAQIKPDLDNDCVHIKVTQVDVNFDNVTVHNTKVKLNFAGIVIDVSFIANEIADAAPDLGKDIANAIRGVLSDAIMVAATRLPCIKIPVQSMEVV